MVAWRPPQTRTASVEAHVMRGAPPVNQCMAALLSQHRYSQTLCLASVNHTIKEVIMRPRIYRLANTKPCTRRVHLSVACVRRSRPRDHLLVGLTNTAHFSHLYWGIIYLSGQTILSSFFSSEISVIFIGSWWSFMTTRRVYSAVCIVQSWHLKPS